MKASISMESLWLTIQSMSLRNKEWLSSKLDDDIQAQKKEQEEEFISKEEILAGIDAGLKELAERKRNGKKAMTLEELIDEL